METQIPMPEMTHKISHSPAKMSQVIRAPIKCHGGKFYLSSAHLDVCRSAMLRCGVWKEGCTGGGNFTLQAEPVGECGRINFLIEQNSLIANIWFCYCHPDLAPQLVKQLRMIRPINKTEMEAEFAAAKMVCQATWNKSFRINGAQISNNERIALATARIVLGRMSRGGMGSDFAWQDRERGGKPGEINSWETFVENHSPRVAARCVNCVPVNADVEALLDPNNAYEDGGVVNPDVFWYLDVPYLHETRSAKKVYGPDEWGSDKHERILQRIVGAESSIAICGYESELYRRYLNKDNGWTLHRFAIVNHSGQGEKKQDRIECLWTNF